jgi:hypothetical protein
MNVSRRMVGGVLGALLAAPAMASSVLHLDLDAMCARAEVIALARVVRAEAAWDAGRIWTTATLAVDEAWKGAAKGGEVVVRQPGGVVGDVGQVVHGLPALVPGARAVVFLERGRGGTGVFGLVGMAQGYLAIEEDAREGLVARQDLGGLHVAATDGAAAEVAVKPLRLPLAELRARVRAAAGGAAR